MSYRVVYTEHVIANIDQKVDHLRSQHVSEQAIEGWFEGLFDRIQSLYEMPRLYGLDHAASEKHGYDIHKLTYKSYIVRYRIEHASRTVYVLSFFHGSRRREA